MNGVHDMGGMHGMGAITAEHDEPVFHASWEARVFGINRAMGAWRLWSIDAGRFQRELIAPTDYFRMSYYERFLAGLVALMRQHGLVTASELEQGRPDAGATRRTPALTADNVPGLVARGVPARRDAPVPARFQAGQRVRTRNINPVGHTRLPRYARAKLGTVDRDHGVFVFPDTHALSLGEQPQHVYSVRFAAGELWGDQANRGDAVYVDIWDDHLEPA